MLPSSHNHVTTVVMHTQVIYVQSQRLHLRQVAQPTFTNTITVMKVRDEYGDGEGYEKQLDNERERERERY